MISLILIIPAAGQSFSHQQAAQKLVDLIQKENSVQTFIDSIVLEVIALDSTLSSHRTEILTTINTYLRSPEFKKTRRDAIIYFFTEDEIRNIILMLENKTFTNYTSRQKAILKRYNTTFEVLKKKFIEYVQRKLAHKYH